MTDQHKTRPASTAASPWIITGHGRRLPLLRRFGSSTGISITEIAAALARLCRFTGHTAAHYSVAQHSLLVASLLRHTTRLPQPEAELYALLHDAHEAITGDVSSPMQQALEKLQPGFRAALAHLQDAWDREIFLAAGLVPVPPEDIGAAIRHADRAMLRIELRDLFPETPERDDAMAGLPDLPHPPLKPMPWATAEQAFLHRFEELQVLLRLAPPKPVHQLSAGEAAQ